MSIGVVFLVSATLFGADSVLVSEKARIAVTAVFGRVVFRVDRASNTVSVADEVVARTFLTHVAHQAVSTKALADSSLHIVG